MASGSPTAPGSRTRPGSASATWPPAKSAGSLFPIQRDDIESRAPLDVLPGYSFTPDSRSVVISYGGEIWRVSVDGGSPQKIPFQADVKLDIGPEVKFVNRVDTSAILTVKQIRNPAPSPDGKRVAFTAVDRLYVADLPDGKPRRVTTSEVGEYHPAWSPDGKSLAWITWDEKAGGQIMKVAVDVKNAKPVQLTQVAALYYNIAWSPDGQRIVASRAQARQLQEATGAFFGATGADFVWVPAAGGDVTLINPAGTRDGMHFTAPTTPASTPTARSKGLVSFRWDGTDVKQHLRVMGTPPSGRRLAARGRRVRLPAAAAGADPGRRRWPRIRRAAATSSRRRRPRPPASS